jgi:drug/metabolite transporter, DME family
MTPPAAIGQQLTMKVAPPSPRAVNRLAILAAAVLFSTGGAAIKATAFSSWQVASLRSGVAAVALVALLPAARRRWTLRTAVVGAAYATTMILYVSANKLTTAANTIFLQSTAPLYILLLGPWLLKEPVRRRDLGFMTVLALGMALLFIGRQERFATAPAPSIGNLLAFGSGVAWALTLLGIRWLGRDQRGGEGSLAAVTCGNLIACLVAAPLAFPLGHTQTVDWAVIIFLGVFQIGLAYVALTGGMARVPAFEASLLLLAEPVLNPVWAWLVHGERPGAGAAAGGVLILGATVVKTWIDGRATPGGRSDIEPDAR